MAEKTRNLSFQAFCVTRCPKSLFGHLVAQNAFLTHKRALLWLVARVNATSSFHSHPSQQQFNPHFKLHPLRATHQSLSTHCNVTYDMIICYIDEYHNMPGCHRRWSSTSHPSLEIGRKSNAPPPHVISLYSLNVFTSTVNPSARNMFEFFNLAQACITSYRDKRWHVVIE